MAASKNNPKERKTDQKKITSKCEFCGSDKGVHRIKYVGAAIGKSTRMAWACDQDSCLRFK